MKKSYVNQFPVGTPEYVIAHGRYSKSRGRGPSVSFRGIRNPRKALMAATAAVVTGPTLEFDPYAFAEKIAGRHTPLADSLGLLLMFQHNALKRALLNGADDTTYGTKLEKYLRILKEEGFQIVLETPFKSEPWSKDEPTVEETHYILFHPKDGILLSFDTYGGKEVNGGKFYYNWSPNSTEDAVMDYLSSGCWVEYPKLWSGDHDCREALRLHLNNLRAHGKFVTPWVDQPFIWLLHYMEAKTPGYDYKAINKA